MHVHKLGETGARGLALHHAAYCFPRSWCAILSGRPWSVVRLCGLARHTPDFAFDIGNAAAIVGVAIGGKTPVKYSPEHAECQVNKS